MWRSEWDIELRDNYNVPGGMSARQFAVSKGITKGMVSRRARDLGLQHSTGESRHPTPKAKVCREVLEMPTAVGTVEPVAPISLPPRPAKATIRHTFAMPPPSSPWTTCQWIDDAVGSMYSHKCGAKTVPGRSWCPEHAARVFYTPRRGEKDEAA